LILPDSSAWIEFFRGSGKPLHHALQSLVNEGEDLVTSEVVVMELLAGARTAAYAATLRDVLLEYPVVPLSGVGDYEEAARIYRVCRAAGETVRQMTDCLVAVTAMRAGASILHADRDYDVIARHTNLRIEPVG
jgi:predicted nucleic acid-binding protein